MFFSDAQLQDAINEFKDEGLELLTGMESALLEIQERGMSDERINAVFRAAHTIKGSSGMLKLDHLVEFTHIAENLLDDIRNGKKAISESMITTFLKCKDHMQNLVLFYASHTGKTPDETLRTISHLLMGELQGTPQSVKVDTKPQSASKGKAWDIVIGFGSDVFISGMDPAHFIRFLGSLGEITSIQTDVSKIPPLSHYAPTQCYIHTRIAFTSDIEQEKIEEVFEFIKEDISLAISVIGSEPTSEPEDHEPSAPLHVSTTGPLNDAQNNSSEVSASIVSSTLRVDSDKIDILINLIGEMVIANANVVQKSSQLANDDLIESVSIVSHMLEEVRESAMKIRMVQIGDTFSKFKRIVHDVSKKLGKDVELIINGGETEMDKTIVEKISDPLIHIVRNALDHGLESTNERIGLGKKQKGRLELNAFHDAGTIAIQIIDDGKGLDEERILQKAIEKGLVEPEAKLSQKEIFALIFEAGFSTADAVSDLSGRGVGMDVVRRNIQALRGTVDIQSTKGKGSTFTIRLPLTLAIIDGFLARVGKTHYVIPLDMVLECVELPEHHQEMMNGNEYINLRGTILTLLNLREFFHEKGVRNKSDKENIIVVRSGENRFGLIVEELLGEFQTVIKPLGKIFRGLKGIGGSAILGSGEVALIVDVPILNATISKSHSEKGA